MATSALHALTDNASIRRRRYAFGIGSLASGVFAVVPSVLLLYYLTTVVGIPPAFAGLAVMAPKVVSIFTDPIIGHLSDRVKRQGEAHRRWLMAIGAFAAGFGLWSIFTLPARVPEGGWVAAGLYFVCTIGFSCFAVPYSALPADLEEEPMLRRKLVTTRMTLSFVGALIGAAAAPALAGWLGYDIMGLLLGIFSATAVIVCITNYSPGARRRSVWPPAPRLSLASLADRPYLRVLGGFTLLVIAGNCVSATLPFLVQDSFKLSGTLLGVALFVHLGVGMLATMVWPQLILRIGNTGAWRLSIALMLCSVTALSTAGSAGLIFYAGLVIGGLATSGVQVIGFTGLADAAARSDASGRSGSGIITGLWMACEKVAFALGPLLVGVVMQFAASAGISSRMVLMIAIGILPAALAIAAALVLGRHGEDMA